MDDFLAGSQNAGKIKDLAGPGVKRYPSLFSPISLGPLTLKNRVIMSGHSMKHGEADGTIGDRMVAYITARAAGGAAMVSLESIPVHESSHNFAEQIRLFSDDCLPGLKRLADSVHAVGSKMSAILWHGGPNVSHFGRGPALAPSAIPAPGTGEIAKEISRAEIKSVIQGYADSAKRCLESGFDAIEVQTASNYLLGSFLSPVLNRRTDEYGGSVENRQRLILEVLEAVKEAVGDTLAVGVRTSVDPVYDDGSLECHSVSLDTTAALKNRGLIDWVSILNGSAYARGTSIPTMDLPRAFMANHAETFKQKLDLPIIMAGRIREPSEAENLIVSGNVDVIAMARSWIAEPQWMAKVEAGLESRIRPCMSCNQGCLGFNLRDKPGTCVVNPEAGREFEFPEITTTSKPLTVAIIGGGPAGLEAARVAALRGHSVTLYEASEVLGGTMRLAGNAPHRHEILRPIQWWESELRELGVSVVLNKTVLSQENVQADKVIWAIGAKPSQMAVLRRRPHLTTGISGCEDLPYTRDVLRGEASVTGHVLIIDEEGAWPAISSAEAISAKLDVTQVTVATAAGQWGLPDLNLTAEIGGTAQRIKENGIEVLENTLIETARFPVAITACGQELGPFDSIVLATGTTSRKAPENAVSAGDCVTPRGMWAAVHDATLLAREL